LPFFFVDVILFHGNDSLVVKGHCCPFSQILIRYTEPGTVGAVTEEMIKKYIDNQSGESANFKVWDEGDLSSQGSSLG